MDRRRSSISRQRGHSAGTCIGCLLVEATTGEKIAELYPELYQARRAWDYGDTLLTPKSQLRSGILAPTACAARRQMGQSQQDDWVNGRVFRTVPSLSSKKSRSKMWIYRPSRLRLCPRHASAPNVTTGSSMILRLTIRPPSEPHVLNWKVRSLHFIGIRIHLLFHHVFGFPEFHSVI